MCCAICRIRLILNRCHHHENSRQETRNLASLRSRKKKKNVSKPWRFHEESAQEIVVTILHPRHRKPHAPRPRVLQSSLGSLRAPAAQIYYPRRHDRLSDSLSQLPLHCQAVRLPDPDPRSRRRHEHRRAVYLASRRCQPHRRRRRAFLRAPFLNDAAGGSELPPLARRVVSRTTASRHCPRCQSCCCLDMILTEHQPRLWPLSAPERRIHSDHQHQSGDLDEIATRPIVRPRPPPPPPPVLQFPSTQPRGSSLRDRPFPRLLPVDIQGPLPRLLGRPPLPRCRGLPSTVGPVRELEHWKILPPVYA